MNNTPLISVVMPAYNSEKYISEAIESILNQTFKDFEFIIIDDGSTDRTWEIIQKYAKRDERIVAVRNDQNLNIAKSRNRGVSLSAGRYLVTMDSDDVSLPNRLKDQCEFLQFNSDIHISIGNINVMDEDGNVKYYREYPMYDYELKSKVYRFNPFPNPTVMCRKEVYEKVGEYNNRYVPIDDFDFWLRSGVYFKFGNCGSVVLNYRVFKKSASHSKLHLTESLTFMLRWKAYKLGYAFKLGDLIFNIVHLLSFLFLPSALKIKLFNLLRRVKFIS